MMGPNKPYYGPNGGMIHTKDGGLTWIRVKSILTQGNSIFDMSDDGTFEFATDDDQDKTFIYDSNLN